MIDLDIQINFRSKKTLITQLSGEVQRLIEQGNLQAGDQLPPVRDLAAKLRVNFNTVARAYRQLDMKELITTQQGRGTFVLQKETQLPLTISFLKEAFREDLEAFLLNQSQRTGQSLGDLCEICLEQIQSIAGCAEPVRKNRTIKANRKPGWRLKDLPPGTGRKIPRRPRRMTSKIN